MDIKDIILRWRHRHGYGIHSPWAYELVTEALCSESHYYKFDELHGTESDRQLFRLFVWLKPKHYIARGGTESALAHMKTAYDTTKARCDHEVLYFAADHAWEVEKAFQGGSISEKTCIILEGINRDNRELWQQLIAAQTVTSTFQLPTRGIAFYDPARQKCNYLL